MMTDVETCPRCGKALAVEVGTGFLCCLDCKRRLLGYTWWPAQGMAGSLALFRSRSDAEAAASKAGEAIELAPVWADTAER
jgi:ribosomal protein L37AE/L43A